jgi:DNA-binding transcriptional ArsR family regulator
VSNHDHPVDPERVAAVRRDALPPGEAEAMAGLLTLLADPLRARILSSLLVADEVCVGDLALALGATEDAVSYALRLLRTAGLVRRRREGRMAYYRLPDGDARPALEDALARLRSLTALHPEVAADDAEEA